MGAHYGAGKEACPYRPRPAPRVERPRVASVLGPAAGRAVVGAPKDVAPTVHSGRGPCQGRGRPEGDKSDAPWARPPEKGCECARRRRVLGLSAVAEPPLTGGALARDQGASARGDDPPVATRDRHTHRAVYAQCLRECEVGGGPGSTRPKTGVGCREPRRETCPTTCRWTDLQRTSHRVRRG